MREAIEQIYSVSDITKSIKFILESTFEKLVSKEKSLTSKHTALVIGILI